MKNKKIKLNYIIFLIVLCVSNLNHALIIESNHLATVLDYINSMQNTLVIFDIDNTLAHPPTELGSDEWFYYKVEQKKQEGFDELTSIYYILPQLFYIQFNIALEPTENNISDLIASLVNNGIAVMALSTRSLPIVECTLEQLHNIDINFFMPNIDPGDRILPMHHPCFYKDGILFSGNNDKGQALNCFFDIMNYHPECVIFIDDKMKYLLSVEQALEKHNIPFIVIRYSGCDERVKNFDPTKSDEQWHTLKQQKSKNYANPL